MTERENMMLEETLEYFKRCEEFDDAIRITRENREYLKKYIKTPERVKTDFNLNLKRKAAVGIAFATGLVVFLLTLINVGVDGIAAAGIAGAVVVAVTMTVFLVAISKKFKECLEQQADINRGLNEVMFAYDRNVNSLRERKQKYLAALEDRKLVIIPVKYISVAKQIADYVREGNADSVQEAVDQLEEQVKAMRASRR